MADLIKQRKREEEEAKRRAAEAANAAKIASAPKVEKPASASKPQTIPKNNYQVSIHNALGSNANASDESTMKVNLNSLKTEQNAINVAMRISSDKERDAFLTQYQQHAKKNGIKTSTLDQLRSKVDQSRPSGVYADTVAKKNALAQTRNTAMSSLAGLYDVNGNAININTASYSQVVQGIRSIADPTKRDAAIKNLETLVKTEGSRFYGQTVDKKVLYSYLGSPDFGQDAYDEQVAAFTDAFYPQSGYEEENQSQYFSFVDSIRKSGYTESVQRQLIEKLDEMYMNATGKSAPDMKSVAEVQGTPEEEDKTASDGDDKPGMMEQLGGIVEDVLGWFDGDKEQKNEEGKSFSEKVIESVVDPEWLKKYQEENQAEPESGTEVNRPFLRSELPDGEQGPEQKVSVLEHAARKFGISPIGLYASAGRSDGPAIVKPASAKKEDEDNKLTSEQMVEAFESWVDAGKPRATNLPTHYRVKDDSDVLRAMFEGKLGLVDPQQAQAVLKLAESPTVKQLFGTIANESDYKDMELGNIGGEQAVFRNMTSLGSTAYSVLQEIEDENYPDTLRYDAYLVLAQLAKEADDLEASGMLPLDNEIDPLPALERYLTSNESAMKRLNEIHQAKKLFEEDRAAMLAEQGELKKQALEQARQAVMTGQASEEQIALVRENATDVDLKTLKKTDKGFKARYNDVYSWDDGYFAYGEDAGFENSDVYRSMVVDKGLEDDSDLRFHLSDAMCAILEEDAETARSLGMNLEDYYTNIGGMSNDLLCQRAATRISQQGAKITDEEMQTLSAETGGDGVGWMATGSLGVVHGTNSLYASYADTLYIGMSEGNVVRTAGKMQAEYQKSYGIMGRDMYRAELQSLISSGKLDEGYAKVLNDALRSAGDVYHIGIDPKAYSGILDSKAKAEENIKLTEAYMAENGTEGEQYWFNQISGMTRNAAQAGIAAATTLATANPKLGFVVGYSAPEWSDNVSTRWQQGYGRNTGMLLGTIDTAGSYVANVMTFESIMGRATGANTLFQKAISKCMRGNPAGTVKALAATKGYSLKLVGLNSVAAFAENIIDEAVFDEGKEKLTALFIDKGIVPMVQAFENGAELGAGDVIGSLLGGIRETVDGISGVAKEVAAGFVDAALASSIFAVAGAAGSGVNTYKGMHTAADIASKADPDDLIQYDSVQMALDIANGNSVDIEGFMQAFAQDSMDADFIAKFNASAKQTKVDFVVAQMIATDDGKDGLLPQVKEANEQITSHEEQAAANKAAMDQATETLVENDAQITAGTAGETELSNATNAAMAIVKNKTGYDEHTREAMQKKDKVKAVLDEKMAGTRLAARRQVEADQLTMMQEMAEMAPQIAQQARESELGKIQQKIDDINVQIQQEFDKGDDADYELIDSLSAQAGTLGVYLDDVTADESGETDAEAIRAEAERKLEEIAENKAAYTSAETQAVLETRETTQKFEQEQTDLQDVFKKLHNDPIYVDESQAANILYETGSKNLSEFNRRFGTKLTKTGGKGTPLDGSYYAEMKAMAPGYFKASWDGHPEEALVAMAQRQKMLKQEIADSKEAERRANELYRAKASERFAYINKKAAAIPPGHALSQFENQNIQTSEVSTDETNELLKGTTHEVKTRDALQKTAVNRIARDGLKNTVNALMRTDRMSSEDIAAGRECLALLKRNGDILRHAMLSVKLGKEATKAGQELNTFSLFQKRMAASAAADALEMAAAYNRKKGRYAKSLDEADAEAQMSLGDTQYQPFMEEYVSRSTSDPAMQKLASDINKRSGLTVYWANMPDGVRGFFDRAKGVIVLNQKIGAAQGAYIASIHEYTHFVEQSKQYEEYAKAVLKAAYGKDYETSNAMKLDEGAIRDEYAERGNELTEDLLRKELVAAATEQILLGDESFMRTLFNGGNGGVATRILASIDSFMRKSEAKRKGKEAVVQLELLEAARAKMQDAIAKAGKWKAEANQNAQTQFAMVNPGSHYDYSKPFAEQVEDWKAGKIPKRDTLLVSGTPDVLRDIGFSNLPVAIDQKHMRMILGDAKNADHDLGEAMLKSLPEALKNPIAIIEDSGRIDESVLVIFALKNQNADGRQVIGAVNVSSGGAFNGISVDANRMQTLHSRGDLTERIENAVDKQHSGDVGVYYVNKKSLSLLEPGQSQVLGTLKRDGFINSILDSRSPVNAKPKEQIDTPQFKRWFKGSRVVDEDGLPLVVYHGSDADFNAFDMSKGRSNMDIQGAFFSPYEEDAAGYGGNVRAFYLSIKNPASESVAYSALRKFAGQNGAGIKAREYLQSLGYDGVYNGYDEYIAFSPEQIKSADKNIGLFDPKNPNVNFSIQTERRVQGAQTQLGNQQMISDEDTYDRISAPMPDGDVTMNPQLNGQQTEIRDPDDVNANEVARRVMENIRALEQPDVNADNEWNLPLNQFQRDKIDEFGLHGVKLPGLAYNRATTKQRMLCAVLATPQDRVGPNRQTLTQQLKDLQKGNLAVVTEADYNYILSQAAIVEGSEVDEAGVPLNREGEQAFGRLRDAQANIQPTARTEKLSAWRYINLLSSPVTTMKNIDGNLIIQQAERISTKGAEWLDKKLAEKTGVRTTAAATKEERKAGTAAAAERGRKAFDDYFVAKTSTSRSRNYNAGGDGRVFQTEALETVRNLINFAMDAPDQMFIEKTISEEMAVLRRIEAKIHDEETGELRAMTEGEMYEEAYARASERFYHDHNRMVKIMNEVYNVPYIGTAMRVLIPFAKTPSNVALRMFDYSPLGLAKSVLYDGLYNMRRDNGANFDQRRFVMGMSRGMTGTAITALGAILFKAGILSFGREEEDNQKRRDTLSILGEPYGMYINIGNTKHEIAFTMPALAGLAIGAGIASRIEDDETLYNIAFGVVEDQANQFFENSYLSSINDIFRGYREGSDIIFTTLETMGESYVTQMLSPSILRAFAKAADPYARDTTSSSQIRQMLNEMVIQNWPVLRQTLPVKYDVTGDAATQHKAYQPGGAWENAALHWLDSLLSPTATYSDKDDSTLTELLDLSYVANDTACLPTPLIGDKDWSLSITASFAKELGFKNGNKGTPLNIPLEDSEKRLLNQEYSSLLFNGSGSVRYKDEHGRFVEVTGLREMMNGAAWEKADVKERVDMVADKIKEVKLFIMKKVTDERKKNGEL